MNPLGFSAPTAGNKKRQKLQESEAKSSTNAKNLLKITEVVDGCMIEKDQTDKRTEFIKYKMTIDEYLFRVLIFRLCC